MCFDAFLSGAAAMAATLGLSVCARELYWHMKQKRDAAEERLLDLERWSKFHGVAISAISTKLQGKKKPA